MPSPITYPIGPLVKWGLRVIPPTWFLGESLLDQADDADDALTWRHLQIVAQRGTPVGTVEDKAIMTFDLLNITGGAVDNTWTTTDFTTAESRFSTWLTALLGSISNDVSFVQYRWYRRQFAVPMTADKRFADTGPPERITTIALTGTAGTGKMPYQVAMSITELTPWPRHWGRVYVPGLAVTLGTASRWGSSVLTTASTASGVLLNALHDDELPLVVPSTQQDKVIAGYLLGVRGIQIDDIPDVQRRRRAKQPAVRTVIPLS